jgi:glycosyltransferase involved in cell wall biosynthesis
VQAQTYTNWEHILVDDCSTDDSVKIIEKYASLDNRVKLIKLSKNSGAGFARNTAIEVAKGKFIAFLDADDYWHKDKLNKQIAYMLRRDCSFSYTQYYIVEDKSEPKYIVHSPDIVSYKSILKNGYIGCLTAIYDADKIGKHYMPIVRKRQDWILWINILKKIGHAYGIQEPLAYYRVGNKSLSNNKFRLVKHNFNVYHKELGMSFAFSVWRMAVFLIHYFYFKSFKIKRLNA